MSYKNIVGKENRYTEQEIDRQIACVDEQITTYIQILQIVGQTESNKAQKDR